MDQITIREILEQVTRGQIRIPAFQRGFVWEPERVAYLMDSIYKGYPFGSLLFWRTKERLRTEKSLGPFTLPDPKKDYPVDYVLDGQQRITSIFGVFQTDLTPSTNQVWQDIYFDMLASEGPQESQFVALLPTEVNPARHFPLRTLFNTVEYRKATATLEGGLATRIDGMQSVFKETRIPLQLSDTEDKATVAIIFERVNRQGVPLDTLQLLSAWTWSEDFQLHEQFTDLAEQLAPFGFEDIGEDTELLLRCCSAILAGDASPQALMNLTGNTVRERFSEILNGVRGAVDFLKANFGAHSLAVLPFTTLLVPLSVLFAIPGKEERHLDASQRQRVVRWLWRSAFARRYSSGVLRNLKTDIEEMKRVRDGVANKLGDFAFSVTPAFFTDNVFGIGNVNTKTFVLLLAARGPRSLISGTPVDLAQKLSKSNKTEFHHLMPKAFLEESKQDDMPEGCLANFAFVSRAENRELGGVAPSKYQSKLGAPRPEILSSAMIPASLFDDMYGQFCKERSVALADFAKAMCA
jgi:hypothetical protein